jgi:hypothetical protein
MLKKYAPGVRGVGGMEGTTNNFGKRLPNPIARTTQASDTAPSEPYYFLHGTRYRITEPLKNWQWQELFPGCEAFMLDRRNEDRLRARGDLRLLPKRPYYRHFMKNYLDDPLVVIHPTDEDLRLLDALPGIIQNYSELARDQIVADAEQAHNRFFEHFLDPRHGTHELVRIEQTNTSSGTTYTRQRGRGHLFAVYSDKRSKVTGELNCLHIEGRYTGWPALRDQLGINRPADWLDFDHEAYWDKVLWEIYIMNFERLAIYDANRRRGDRRRKPSNEDAAAGRRLYDLLSCHRDQPQYNSLQRFMDAYKPPSRPFLIRLPWSNLIDPTFHLP